MENVNPFKVVLEEDDDKKVISEYSSWERESFMKRANNEHAWEKKGKSIGMAVNYYDERMKGREPGYIVVQLIDPSTHKGKGYDGEYGKYRATISGKNNGTRKEIGLFDTQAQAKKEVINAYIKLMMSEPKPKNLSEIDASKLFHDKAMKANINAEIKKLLDVHISKFNAKRMGMDDFGDKIIKAHSVIAKKFGMNPQAAQKVINDYVDSNVKMNEDIIKIKYYVPVKEMADVHHFRVINEKIYAFPEKDGISYVTPYDTVDIADSRRFMEVDEHYIFA